ncbi:MAG: RNA polymerase sigma factor [Nannocystaceae bacterium]
MYRSMTDGELHDRVLAGDKAAVATLVARYLEAINSYFHRRLPNEAEDLAHEVFVVYVEQPERCKHGKVRAFLFGVAHNKLLHAYRWKGRHPEEELPSFSLLEAADPALSSVVGGREEVRRLLDAFRFLTPEQTAVMELLLVGLQIDEVAAVLERNVNTCKTWKRLAIQELRKHIHELRISVREAVAALYELGLMERPNVRELFDQLGRDNDESDEGDEGAV